MTNYLVYSSEDVGIVIGVIGGKIKQLVKYLIKFAHRTATKTDKLSTLRWILYYLFIYVFLRTCYFFFYQIGEKREHEVVNVSLSLHVIFALVDFPFQCPIIYLFKERVESIIK